MPRTDIWKDGIKSRFSRENQPANRGRKKGQPNRATTYRAVLYWIGEITQLDEQNRLNARNARRRERYAQKKAGGTTHPAH